MSKVEDFLSQEEEQAIVEAIRLAELNTSGEIRVHLEATFQLSSEQENNIMNRALTVFEILHMNNTKNGNGVLIYVAVNDKQLAIIGDEGINKVVPAHFWEDTKDIILSHFRNNEMKEGLVQGIAKAGEQLKTYFPYGTDDINELPNEIST